MVAFAFLPQDFGRLQGPTNDTFSLMNAARVLWTIRGGGNTIKPYLLTCC